MMFFLLPRSASSEGIELDEDIGKLNRRLNALSTFGIESFVNGDLVDVFNECQHPNWDGHNALPVSFDSLELAQRFLGGLPLGTILPTEVGAEPDGQLTLEWFGGRRRTLSISFDPQGFIHYAALTGPGRAYGTEPLFEQVPKTVLTLIQEVMDVASR